MNLNTSFRRIAFAAATAPLTVVALGTPQTAQATQTGPPPGHSGVATIVRVDSGALHGQTENHGDTELMRFSGIPYAAPPVGNRRWAAPQRPQPWTGVRDARQAWENLGGQIVGNPTAVQHGTSQQVHARTSSGAVYQKAYAPGPGWLEWTSIGGNVADDPIALSDGNALHIFAWVPDSRLYHRAYVPGGWHAWEDLGGNIR